MQFELIEVGPWSYYHFPSLTRAGVVHGFMTKSSDPIINDPQQRQEFIRVIGGTAIIIMQQEHGDSVHLIEKGERPGAGDGLVLLEKGVAGVIKTADCLPVILYDVDYPVAAVVHAGWRGTVQKIARKAAGMMIGMGVPPARINALIGPGIGPCCYNVGEDVVSAFQQEGFSARIFEKRGSSTFLDLRRANRELLENEGIGTIYNMNLCTSCRQDLFFSARRDSHKGRQISFVLLKG